MNMSSGKKILPSQEIHLARSCKLFTYKILKKSKAFAVNSDDEEHSMKKQISLRDKSQYMQLNVLAAKVFSGVFFSMTYLSSRKICPGEILFSRTFENVQILVRIASFCRLLGSPRHYYD